MSSLQKFRLEIRETASLAVPVIIAQMSHTAMQMIDVAMVGHYGSADLGGMALGSALSFSLLVVCFGILAGASPMVSQAEGAGDRPACGRAFSQAIWLAAALGLLLILLLQQASAVLQLTGQPATLAALAQTYVTPLSLGMPAALGFIAVRQLVEGLSLTRPAMIISLLALPLNALLNLVLMYGYFGLPALGVAGTGLATAIVQWGMFLALFSWVWRADRFRPYAVRDLLHGPRWPEMRRLLTIGLPIGASYGLEVSSFTGAALMMGWFGPTPMAAHQIALNLCSTTFMVPLGISIAGSIRVGHAQGRRDLAGTRLAGWTTLGLAAFVMSLSALMLISVPGLLLSIYTSDRAVIEVGIMLLAVGAAFQLFDGIQVAGSGVLRGLKDTRVPMLANGLAYWGIGLPTAYGLGVWLEWGPTGLWWGLSGGLFVAAVAHSLRFRWLVRQASP